MLQIKGVKKQYKTGNYIQKALDGVSLNLRDSEFVAILGPSGSGKTTLLNVIGGLDRYDEGDLVINGVSTRKYKDRDWDSYRNHTIGFVFQSYNLIMHQTVLANVELALTISGISGAERKKRAEEALRQVGLAEHMHKKPNQMSGGQMQRVAIARALVNDPDIVLADEPTGALDSEMSVQIMDLLKEVAKDRLVVMVTHNPDLAKQYATRIVTIQDGRITDDTDPYQPEERFAAPPIHKNLGKASMSFLTALSLSFNNLKTKKARTLLVSFAGSIGIIGIALILALSSGVDQYIQMKEEETLSVYPLQIEEAGFDFASLMTDPQIFADTAAASGEDASKEDNQIGVQEIAEKMLTQVNTNDLGALKSYLDERKTEWKPYVSCLDYLYNVTPQIYRQVEGEILQVNPNSVFSSLDMGADKMSSMMGSMMNADVFTRLPSEPELYEEQYTLKAGHWPESADDLVLVLSQNGNISDAVLYTLGMRDRAELQEVIDRKETETSSDGTSPVTSSGSEKNAYAYDDFLGMEFSLVCPADLYAYDDTYGVWMDRSENDSLLEEKVKEGRTLTITGIVQPKKSGTGTMSSSSIAYPSDLVIEMIRDAEESDVVKAQMEDPEINVLTGKRFDEENDENSLDLSSLFTVDQDAIRQAFQMDQSAGGSMDFSALSGAVSAPDIGNVPLGNFIDSSSLSQVMPSLSEEQIQQLMDGVQVTATGESLSALFQTAAEGFLKYAASDPTTDYATMGDALLSYLQSEEAGAILQQQMEKFFQENSGAVISEDELREMLTPLVSGFLTYLQDNPPDLSDATQVSDQIAASFSAYLSSPAGSAALAEIRSGIMNKLSSVQISSAQVQETAQMLADGYTDYAQKNQLPDPEKFGEAFAAYLKTDEAKNLILNGAGSMINTEQLQKNLSSVMAEMTGSAAEKIGAEIQSGINSLMGQVSARLQTALGQMAAQFTQSMTENMGNLFSVDPDALAGALKMNMSAGEMQELLQSLMIGANQTSYENNLAAFGYADLDQPMEIDIYPKDFEAKDVIVDLLDQYNQEMRAAGNEDLVITYTDMISTMMSSVTDILNTISIVLIAFVAISLVVSSIMIGVITYISVLERRKEIGILRAIGASRKNIADVFNAETFITGLLAGVIGISVTAILTIPANMLIQAVAEGVEVHVALPVPAALLLVGLSIVLTLLAGLLPAGKASRSDPVAALRTE